LFEFVERIVAEVTNAMDSGSRAGSRRRVRGDRAGFAGCVSQGDSRDEAIANVREAIAAYIEDCRESGEAVPTDGGWEIVEDVQQ